MHENKTASKQAARRPKQWSSTQSRISVLNEEFPDAKTLLISSKRPKAFLVRTARELLAGGTEVLILSALGDAMPLGVHLQVALESTKAATVIRIETTYNLTSSHKKDPSYTPGLRIFMKKHPEFKGSRISPGYVSFCDSSLVPTPLYDLDSFTNDKFCSLIRSSSFKLTDVPEFTKFFSPSEVNMYFNVFTALFDKAIKAVNEETKAVTTDNLTVKHPNIKLGLCRASPEIGKPDSIHGSCFVVILKENYPLDKVCYYSIEMSRIFMHNSIIVSLNNFKTFFDGNFFFKKNIPLFRTQILTYHVHFDYGVILFCILNSIYNLRKRIVCCNYQVIYVD